MSDGKGDIIEKASKPHVKKAFSENEKVDKKNKMQNKNNNAKIGNKNGKVDKVDDSSVEKEFLAFVAKLKSKYPGNGIAYQINNFPEVRLLIL